MFSPAQATLTADLLVEPRPHPVRTELAALLKLSIPIAAAQGGQALMGLVDVAVVGRVSKTQLAAVGLANSLFFAISVVGMGLMMGLDPLASQALGAGDKVRARQLLWQGMWLAVFTSAALELPMLLSPAILTLMKVPPETASLAVQCLEIRMVGLPAMLLFVAVRSYLQATGVTRPLVWAVVAGNLFNFNADVMFVFGWGPIPELGGPGSAIATSLGLVLQLGILALALRSGESPSMPPGSRRPLRADLVNATRVGLPIGLQMGAEVGVFALAGLLAGRMGDAVMAAHQIALTLASFTFCVAIGVGNAGSVRVGWAVGQGDTVSARRSGLVAIGSGAALMSLSAIAFMLAPAWFAGLLTDQPEVVLAVTPLMVVAGVFQISDGIQGVSAGVLRGAGDTHAAFVANVVGHYAIGLPIAVVLGEVLDHGIVGIWWGLCAGLTAVAAFLLIRFWRLSSRPIRPLEFRASSPPAVI